MTEGGHEAREKQRRETLVVTNEEVALEPDSPLKGTGSHTELLGPHEMPDPWIKASL